MAKHEPEMNAGAGLVGAPSSRPDPVPSVRPHVPRRSVDRVRVTSLPNIVFLYPTMLVSLLAAIGLSSGAGGERSWTIAFLAVLGLNLCVLAFDFPRITSLTILFLVAAVAFGAILLNQRVEFLPGLAGQMRHLDPRANAQLYWLIFGFLAVIIAVVLIDHHLIDYWEVRSNEILRHHGVLGDMDRLPAPGVRLQKEIKDIFEFILLGSGRLIITPQGGGNPIVLDNVPRVNRVEKQLKEVLGVTEVEVNFG